MAALHGRMILFDPEEEEKRRKSLWWKLSQKLSDVLYSVLLWGVLIIVGIMMALTTIGTILIWVAFAFGVLRMVSCVWS